MEQIQKIEVTTATEEPEMMTLEMEAERTATKPKRVDKMISFMIEVRKSSSALRNVSVLHFNESNLLKYWSL